METTPTGADLLAQTLAAYGCKRAYGIPGGEVLAIVDAMDRAGIEFILVKHENAGGFMAEGGWHADGFPPVLVATIGPGVANAVNSIANAIQDRVPLIFVTGCLEPSETETYTHQIFDHTRLLQEITKASFTATSKTCGLVGSKAVQIAMEPQAGPVHIDLPVSVAEGPADEALPAIVDIRSNTAPAIDTTFKEAANLLEKAKLPLAIVGVDAVNEQASAEINQFCEKYQIPVIATYKAKGMVSETSTLAIGSAGLSPKADTLIKPLIEKSDCLLLIGYDPIEMRVGWRNPWKQDQTVVEITPVLRTHGMHSVSHTIRSSIAPALAELSGQMKATRDAVSEDAAQVRTAFWDMFSAKSDFGPDRVFATLRETMPKETVATADSGAHRILLSQMWQSPIPRGMLQSSALCTMACAVPIAAGFKQASPKTPVIAFVGDAGMEMDLGELATLREYKIPLIICVLVDESLTLIEMKQRASQRPNVGVDFTGSDFPAVANALGGHGVWIDDPETLIEEANAAMGRDTFTLLACRIGRKAYDGTF